jgi:hypothetical protein
MSMESGSSTGASTANITYAALAAQHDSLAKEIADK